jgi:four helix bundle protein
MAPQEYILRNLFSVEKMTLESPGDIVIYRSRLNARINRNRSWRLEAVARRPMRNHAKLPAFQLADPVALAIYEQTRSFPREEIFGLTSPLRRAAVSIASNIVEGAARSSAAEYLHSLDTACGSAREVEYQVSLAVGLGLLPEPAHRDLSALTVETSKVRNGLLRSFRKH